MVVDESSTSAKPHGATSLFGLPKTAPFIGMGLVIALLLGGAGGYYLGLQQRSIEKPLANAPSSTPSPAASPRGSLASPGRISPTPHIISNPTSTPYPPEKFVVRSQALSPDGTRKIMFKAPKDLAYGNPEELAISDARGTNETVVLSKDFLGEAFDELMPTNWSSDSKYVFVSTGFIETGNWRPVCF